MVLFFSATLGISIVGIWALLVLKRFEMTTGKVLGGRVRPSVDAFFHAGLVWVEHRAPALLRFWLNYALANGKKFLRYAAAHSILALERLLRRVLQLLHYTTQPGENTGEVSRFLREVAEHKKKLLKRTPVEK